MNQDINNIEKNISNTLAQMKIAAVPASFDEKLHQALLTERDKMSQKVTVLMMPWQKIMSLAAAFLLAVSLGFLSAEYIDNSRTPIVDDAVTDNKTEHTLDMELVQRVPHDLMENNSAMSNSFSTCSFTEVGNVINSASVTSMRIDMERTGYYKLLDCSSLEQCISYLQDNNLDSSQCMVVGYIGETSYVILSNMESLVTGDTSNLEGLVGLYEVYSK